MINSTNVDTAPLPDFGPHYLRNAMLGRCPATLEQADYPIADRIRMLGYDASRWNKLGYGENLDAVLPCRHDACKMRLHCSVKTAELWPVMYGEPCPDECLFLKMYVESFLTGWGKAAGLEGEESQAIGERMALLELRRARLSMRMRDMWDLGAQLEDGSMNPDFLHEISICGRYMTRMDRELDRMRLMLFGPVWDDDPSGIR